MLTPESELCLLFLFFLLPVQQKNRGDPKLKAVNMLSAGQGLFLPLPLRVRMEKSAAIRIHAQKASFISSAEEIIT